MGAMPTPPRRLVAALVLSTALLAPPAVCRANPIVVSETTIGGRRALLVGPDGAHRDARLPLVVLLHWSGSTPEEIARLADWPALPMRLLFPQGAHARPSGWSWFPAGYAAMDEATARVETFRAVDELAEWLEAARRELPTEGAPIVAGVSYGGDLAFLLAVRRPESIAAAFPVAARFLPGWLPEARPCRDDCPPIVALHGEADATVPIVPTRNAVAELARRGWPVELRGYAGVGHDFSAAMRADLERTIAARLGDPRADERRALKAQADAWDAAIVRKDRAAIEVNLATEFRQIDGYGNVEDRATFVAGLMSPDLEIDPYGVEDFEIRFYGDVALVTGRTRMTGRFRGEPFTSHYRYTDTYVRRDGVWKVAQVQITKIAE